MPSIPETDIDRSCQSPVRAIVRRRTGPATGGSLSRHGGLMGGIIERRVLDILPAMNDQDSYCYPEATCPGSRFTDRARTPTSARAGTPWPAAVQRWYCHTVPGLVIAQQSATYPLAPTGGRFPPGRGRPGFHLGETDENPASSPMSLPVVALRHSRRCCQRCDNEAGRVTRWSYDYTAHQPPDPRCKRTPARRAGTPQLRPANPDRGTQPLGQTVRG